MCAAEFVRDDESQFASHGTQLNLQTKLDSLDTLFCAILLLKMRDVHKYVN